MNEHPTQALLDMLTMYERFDKFEGKKIAICGDIYHSRVVRSNAIGLAKVGAKVSVYGPRTMMPIGIEKMGVTVADSVEDCVRDADAVMGLRVQLERMKSSLFPSVAEYAKFYAITPEVLKLAKPDAFLMHPGPCNHGVELPTAVYDCDQSVINKQVTNGVAVRMAVLYLLMARRNNV
jgi:aspartate carbamoyltransferase catalytic subunit